VCPKCGVGRGWRLGDGRIMCAACGRRTSVTAGTIFDRTRTPLTVWFTACWLFATAKDGISALSLQRSLEIGSYQTAWAMLGRLRSVLVRPGRDRLAGRVEVDETYIGGEEPGLRGGRAPGKKVLTGIAVEVTGPKGIGRCRLALLADGSSASLHPFVTGHVEPGATVITDAWMGYHGLAGLGYVHQRRSQRAARARGDDPGELLPAVHRVASLAKRWLLSTHQGSVEEAHLQSYLDEFVFRFNRRRSRSRGLVFYRLLELAVGHDPVRYRNIVAGKRPRKIPPAPPATRGHPPSLERPPAERPWRAADLDGSSYEYYLVKCRASGGGEARRASSAAHQGQHRRVSFIQAEAGQRSAGGGRGPGLLPRSTALLGYVQRRKGAVMAQAAPAAGTPKASRQGRLRPGPSRPSSTPRSAACRSWARDAAS